MEQKLLEWYLAVLLFTQVDNAVINVELSQFAGNSSFNSLCTVYLQPANLIHSGNKILE